MKKIITTLSLVSMVATPLAVLSCSSDEQKGHTKKEKQFMQNTKPQIPKVLEPEKTRYEVPKLPEMIVPPMKNHFVLQGFDIDIYAENKTEAIEQVLSSGNYLANALKDDVPVLQLGDYDRFAYVPYLDDVNSDNKLTSYANKETKIFATEEEARQYAEDRIVPATFTISPDVAQTHGIRFERLSGDNPSFISLSEKPTIDRSKVSVKFESGLMGDQYGVPIRSSEPIIEENEYIGMDAMFIDGIDIKNNPRALRDIEFNRDIDFRNGNKYLNGEYRVMSPAHRQGEQHFEINYDLGISNINLPKLWIKDDEASSFNGIEIAFQPFPKSFNDKTSLYKKYQWKMNHIIFKSKGASLFYNDEHNKIIDGILWSYDMDGNILADLSKLNELDRLKIYNKIIRDSNFDVNLNSNKTEVYSSNTAEIGVYSLEYMGHKLKFIIRGKRAGEDIQKSNIKCAHNHFDRNHNALLEHDQLPTEGIFSISYDGVKLPYRIVIDASVPTAENVQSYVNLVADALTLPNLNTNVYKVPVLNSEINHEFYCASSEFANLQIRRKQQMIMSTYQIKSGDFVSPIFHNKENIINWLNNELILVS